MLVFCLSHITSKYWSLDLSLGIPAPEYMLLTATVYLYFNSVIKAAGHHHPWAVSHLSHMTFFFFRGDKTTMQDIPKHKAHVLGENKEQRCSIVVTIPNLYSRGSGSPSMNGVRSVIMIQLDFCSPDVNRRGHISVL